MKRILVLAAVAASMVASAAQAVIVTYTSKAAFDAALRAFVLEDFSDTTLVPGLTFTSNAGNIANGLFNDRPVTGGAQTTFNFAGGTTAFGGIFDLSPGGFGQGLQFRISLVGGGTQQVGVTLADVTNGFFGFTSTDAFSAVRIRASTNAGVAETYTLDNVQFGDIIPEPGSWMMMIAGFGLVGATMRRRTAVSA